MKVDHSFQVLARFSRLESQMISNILLKISTIAGIPITTAADDNFGLTIKILSLYISIVLLNVCFAGRYRIIRKREGSLGVVSFDSAVKRMRLLIFAFARSLR